MDRFDLDDAMRDELRGAWHRYVDRVAPFRELLFGYCRRLTPSVWDAEDLAQETLLRGFHHLAYHHDPIENLRAYSLRIATHAWIDILRGRERETHRELAEDPAPAPAVDPALAVDAGRVLIGRLAPRERAALILKDLFDMPLDEIAVVLETTVGAVKSALHRGRRRLAETQEETAMPRTKASDALVDRFVQLYNANDKLGMIDFIQDNATVSNLGVGTQYGAASLAGKTSWIEGSLGGHPEWPEPFRFEAMRASRAAHAGEPIALIFRTRKGHEALESVIRLQEEDGRVSELLSYSFCPELLREVGEGLGLEVRTGLCRYPTPEPGGGFEPRPGS